MFPLSTMVLDHMRYNIYPPRGEFTSAAVEAIEAVNNDEPDAEIDAPSGTVWPNGKDFLRADKVVSLFNLFDFLSVSDDDEWEVDDFDV